MWLATFSSILDPMRNGKSHGTLITMGSRHLGRPESTRVPEHTSEAARHVLDEHRRTVHGFLAACLAALAAEPRRLLDLLEPYWPEGKRTGRPPKARD